MQCRRPTVSRDPVGPRLEPVQRPASTLIHPGPVIGNVRIAMDTSNPRTWIGHVIVCGVQGLGVRVVELLRSAGIRVVIIGTAAQEQHLRVVQTLDVPRIDASPRNPESLWAAGLAGALCVV